MQGYIQGYGLGHTDYCFRLQVRKAKNKNAWLERGDTTEVDWCLSRSLDVAYDDKRIRAGTV